MSLEEAARSLLNAVEDSGHKADVMAACQALRAALAEADTPTPNPWKDEVIEKLVISHIYKAEHDDNPAKALHDLLSWEVAVALDPCVSSDAQALIDRGRAEAEDIRAQKDAAYLERNQCVALIARMAVATGLRACVTKTAIPEWSDDWHGCVYITLPTGQVSWHFHDSQAHLFAGLQTGTETWDGHDTPEKYRRVAAAFTESVVNQELTTAEPVAWAISYDGKTPYSLYEYGDCALLDLEVKRIGGTACKMPLYLHPPRRESESEPVAWHICDNIGALVTADRKEASAARECGHTVRELVFREPRRESAESAELSDDTLVSLWNAAKASTLVNTWHNDQHKIAELRAVLRAAGGEE